MALQKNTTTNPQNNREYKQLITQNLSVEQAKKVISSQKINFFGENEVLKRLPTESQEEFRELYNEFSEAVNGTKLLVGNYFENLEKSLDDLIANLTKQYINDPENALGNSAILASPFTYTIEILPRQAQEEAKVEETNESETAQPENETAQEPQPNVEPQPEQPAPGAPVEQPVTPQENPQQPEQQTANPQ